MSEKVARPERPVLPPSVTASVWILAALGAVGLVSNGPMLVFLLGMSGLVTPRTALPALTLHSVVVVAGIIDLVCAVALRRRHRWPRLAVALVPAVGIVLMFAALVLGVMDSGRAAPYPVPLWSALLMAAGGVLTQGITVILVLVPAGLLWSRGARTYFGTRAGGSPA